jgi:hypothetical protein
MNSDLQALPAGQQIYDSIRNENKLYVDKTGFIPRLEKKRPIIFLARPRRFGKSLTVSTLEAYYAGRKDLFKGLAAEPNLNSSDFTPKPVIHLNMSTLEVSSLDSFNKSIIILLKENADKNKISLNGDTVTEIFSNLIYDLYKRANFKQIQNDKPASAKVILLIDEYDSPMIRLLHECPSAEDQPLIDKIRSALRLLYLQIKGKENYLYLTFITGVTKFSRISVFSELNNLTDISLDPDFGSLTGFTQAELESNFASHIKVAAREFNTDTKTLIKEIKDYYDGFSFDGVTKLYNPDSIMRFFSASQKRFSAFWFRSGSAALIRDKIAEWNVLPKFFSGLTIDADSAEFPGEINNTSPELFLYQSGYLTLQKTGNDSFTLDYPNTEVRLAMNRLFLENCYSLQDRNAAYSNCSQLNKSLQDGDIPEMINVLSRCLTSISYQVMSKRVRPYLASETQAPPRSSKTAAKETEAPPTEYVFQSLLQILFTGAGFHTSIESQNIIGRSDLVIFPLRFGLLETAAVIELKIKGPHQTARQTAEEGFKQILSRRYGEQYENPILIALAIDASGRQIEAGIFEKDGQTVQWTPSESASLPD